MRKFIVLMLLVLVSSGAAAWVKLGKSADDGFDYYVDPVTIRRSGDMAKMSLLYELEKKKSSVNAKVESGAVPGEFMKFGIVTKPAGVIFRIS